MANAVLTVMQGRQTFPLVEEEEDVTGMHHEVATWMNTWKSLLMMSATPGWRTFTATTRLTPSMVITALCTCSNASMGSKHDLQPLCLGSEQLLKFGVQAASRVWGPSSKSKGAHKGLSAFWSSLPKGCLTPFMSCCFQQPLCM